MTNQETELAAVHGYAAWLQTFPHESTVGNDFRNSLLHILDIYAREINRRMRGTKATASWLGLIGLTRKTAMLLRDELLESNPALLTYSPLSDPTIEEMPIRMLRDAGVVFDAALSEQQKPHIIVRLADVMQRILHIA